MYKLIFTLSVFLMINSNGFSQCCPYVDPIEIIPASPNEGDSIYVVTQVTTPNMGAYLGYTLIDGGNDIRIEACYYSGTLTALQTYTDTINLGVKPAGVYDITFVAYQSGNDVNCDYSDSNEVSASTTVLLSLAEQTGPRVSVFPNPVNNGTIYISGNTSKQPVDYRLYNIAGKTELKGRLVNTNSIDVGDFQGIYFLEIVYEGTTRTEKIIIR